MEQSDAWRMTDRLDHESGKGDPFAAAIRATRMPMIITDPRQTDNPIVFVNDAFLRLTGYHRDEIMGTNCRFLQGEDTDLSSVKAIAGAIKAGTDINIDLLNYRKDGTSFWNALYISPVSTMAGEIQYFFASQFDVTDRKEMLAAKTALLHEVDHRVKNNLQLVSALITMQIRTIDDQEVRHSLNTMLRRIESLSTVHRRLYQSGDVTRFSIADFVQDIVTDLLGATGRRDIRVIFDLEEVTIPAEKASSLALMVNELVTNVLKHAFPAERPGIITIAVQQMDANCRLQIEDDGVGLPSPPPAANPSFGLNLIRMLARQLRAVTTWSTVEPAGTRVVIELPLERLMRGA